MATNDINKDIAAQAAECFEREVRHAITPIKSPDILLAGAAGVGKSTLVNMVFGPKLAAETAAQSETAGFHICSVPRVSVNIVDARGYTGAGQDAYKDELAKYLDQASTDAERRVRICWYCISVGDGQVAPFDLQVIAMIRARNIPVAVVLTQCDRDTADGAGAARLRAEITAHFGKIPEEPGNEPDIVQDKEKAKGKSKDKTKEKSKDKSKGKGAEHTEDRVPCFEVSYFPDINARLGRLPKLVDWSAEKISGTNLRLGFIAAQRVTLDRKARAVETRIRWYAATAAGIGAVPIPVSDSIVLTGLQMKMAADIYTIYGFDGSVTQSVRDLIQGRVASTVGRLVAGNVIKLIPGAGSVVGAAVNAAVASSLTYALGRALSAACRHVCREIWLGNYDEIDTLFSAEHLYEAFKQFSHRRDNPSQPTA